MHVIGRLNVGGPAHLVTSLARASGSVVAAGAVQAGEVEHADLAGVDLHRIRGLGRTVRPTDDARAVLALTRLLRQVRPDVVHTHTAKAGVLGRAAACGTPSAARVHTFHGHLLHGYFRPRTVAAVTAVERGLARSTDVLVAVGERVRDDLLDAGVGRPDQWAVVPPGVVPPSRHDRDGARSRLGLPLDRPVVAFVGRLVQVKRPDRLLRLARAHPEAVFAVAGDGPLRASLQAVAPANVRFLGWVTDVGAVWSAADAAVLTSDNEGMPLTLVEAAMAGLPAVTTRAGSAEEVVLDGQTGLVVPVDGDGLVEAVGRLLRDGELRAALGRQARTRALEVFSVAAMVRAHEELYARLTRR